MSNEDGEVQFMVWMDAALKRQVDARPESNKEFATQTFWERLGGESKTIVDLEIEEAKSDIEHLERKKAKIIEDIEEREEDLQRLREKKEAQKSEKELYNDELSIILSRMEDGEIPYLTPDHGELADLAESHDKTRTDVYNDARELAAEQDRRLYNTDFMEMRKAKLVPATDKKLIADAFHDGDSK